MSRGVLVRGKRSWLKRVYRHKVRVVPDTKRLLASLRAYRHEPLGNVIARMLDASGY